MFTFPHIFRVYFVLIVANFCEVVHQEDRELLARVDDDGNLRLQLMEEIQVPRQNSTSRQMDRLTYLFDPDPVRAQLYHQWKIENEPPPSYEVAVSMTSERF